jgi:hypothetical protein
MMSIMDSNQDLGGTTLLLPLNVWEGEMGRTVMPYSQVMEAERERFRAFRRALSKEDQEAFDRLFDRAKMHTSAGVYMLSNPWPMDTILLSICLEHGKVIEQILHLLKEKKI